MFTVQWGYFKTKGGVWAYNKAIICRREHQSYKGDALDKKKDNRVTNIHKNCIWSPTRFREEGLGWGDDYPLKQALLLLPHVHFLGYPLRPQSLFLEGPEKSYRGYATGKTTGFSREKKIRFNKKLQSLSYVQRNFHMRGQGAWSNYLFVQ